jgi:cytochrome b561
VRLLNSSAGYGALTKLFHWLVAGLFALQIGSGLVMTRLGEGARVAGLAGDDLYNWHKTIGLLALLVALARIQVRRMGELPPWAPTLTMLERRIVHRAEQALYGAMLIMPVSGFIHVMAGGYGVLLAGLVALPNPIGKWQSLAELGQVLHMIGGITLGLALAAHLGVVLRHALWLRDGLLRRML